MKTNVVLKENLSAFLNANVNHTADYSDGFLTEVANVYEIEGESITLLVFPSKAALTQDVLENTKFWDPTDGADDQYYDYNPSCLEAILYALPLLNFDDQETVIKTLREKLTSFINDIEQDEDMRESYESYLEDLNNYSINHNAHCFDSLEFSKIINNL